MTNERNQIEQDSEWSRDQEYGGVGEFIAPVEEPEEADVTQFVGFDADEDVTEEDK